MRKHLSIYYIHIHIYKYIYIHTYNIRIYIYIHIHIYICIHIFVSAIKIGQKVRSSLKNFALKMRRPGVLEFSEFWGGGLPKKWGLSLKWRSLDPPETIEYQLNHHVIWYSQWNPNTREWRYCLYFNLFTLFRDRSRTLAIGG